MPLQILVIDDEKSVRTLLKQLFERQGYQVLLADSGDGASNNLKKSLWTLSSLI